MIAQLEGDRVSVADMSPVIQSIREAGADLECLVNEADAPVVETFLDDVRRRATEMTALFREYGVPEEILERLARDRLQSLSVDEAEAEGTPP